MRMENGFESFYRQSFCGSAHKRNSGLLLMLSCSWHAKKFSRSSIQIFATTSPRLGLFLVLSVLPLYLGDTTDILQVTQRVGEWRSNFGSTALAIAIDFCASNQDSAPAELAEHLLVNYGFLYPNPDNIDKTETFRSAFVQKLLAMAHLSRILGHADVPVLNTRNLIKHVFFGALGLCAVSVSQS